MSTCNVARRSAAFVEGDGSGIARSPGDTGRGRGTAMGGPLGHRGDYQPEEALEDLVEMEVLTWLSSVGRVGI